MWLSGNDYEFDDGVHPFGRFLESAEYRDALDENNDGEAITLFGAISLWLTNGSGLSYCPTYESFLLTIISIVEAWSAGAHSLIGGGNFRTEDGTPCAVEMWTSPKNVPIEEIYELPMLHREVFEQIKSLKQDEDRRALLDAVEKLQPSESSNR